MNITDVARGERSLTIEWDGQSRVEYPYIWLRDNDPNELHPDTKERVFDLTSVDIDIQPTSLQLSDSDVAIEWPQKAQASVYDIEWLFEHQPGVVRQDPAAVGRTVWLGKDLEPLPRASAQACRDSNAALAGMLADLKRFGLVIVDQLDDDIDAGIEFGNRIGYKRDNNFGAIFNVESKPDPNNLAYTSVHLPLHTDLPNQEHVPGYQFLHAYKNSATGGESIFADGYAVCRDVKAEAPDDYALLSRIDVPWRFHDETHDIRAHRPVIIERPDGEVDALVFNAHIADLPDMPADVMIEYYGAYQRLMQRIRREEYAVHYRLKAGEMAVFDNYRVMHGRAAFDPTSGERHYRGYYIDRVEVDSRLRVLDRGE
ncbi:MAG: TauD/TfdA family dioxygenase [Pseudomonadota bacterium]